MGDMGTLWGNIGKMENKMEAIGITRLRFRVCGLGSEA